MKRASLAAPIAALTLVLPFPCLAPLAGEPAGSHEQQFRRGDVNDDGRNDIADSIRILEWLFLGRAEISCLKSADVNDDGHLDLSDTIALLGYHFLGAKAPPPPFESCGTDGSSDDLTCERSHALCANEVEIELEVARIVAALEMENGGLGEEAEAPAFGDPELAGAEPSSGPLDPGTIYHDPVAADPRVAGMLGAQETVRYSTAIQWGQMPPDRTQESAFDWSGTIRVNRGALLIRRVVGFEDNADSIVPRTSRLDVSFQSRTGPYTDGLYLTIIDPEPESAEPLTLEYEAALGLHRVTMARLLSGRQTIVVDPQGNRMVATAFAEPADACEHGFLRGRWHALRQGLGRLIGIVSDAEGNPVGHLRGIWGRRRSGEQALFAKYIDLDGRFRGIFAGHYGEGTFAGRWTARGGGDGRLEGEYVESLPGPEVGGFFLGRWSERCAPDSPDGGNHP